jgi:hypothetical protein
MLTIFRYFWQFSAGKTGIYLKNQCYDQIFAFAKISSSLSKKTPKFLTKIFFKSWHRSLASRATFCWHQHNQNSCASTFFFPQKFFFSPNQNNLFKSRRKKWKSEKLFTNWIRRNLESTYNQSSPIYCRSMKRTTRRPFPFFHHRNLNIPLTPINKIRAQCEQSHFQIILWRCIYPLPRTQGCQNYLGTIYQNMKNIPNDQKYTKLTNNIPRERKIFQMTILGIHQHFTFQFCPKYTQKGIFWYANITSGNPPSALCSFLA